MPLDDRSDSGDDVSGTAEVAEIVRNKGFFANPQGAAQMKHALLKGYLPAFVGATGSRSPSNRVVYTTRLPAQGPMTTALPAPPQ